MWIHTGLLILRTGKSCLFWNVLASSQRLLSQRSCAHVSGGFVEVREDRVSVLAVIAERPEEIDVASARASRERLEKQLSGWSGSEEDLEIARTELARSEVRLQLASSRS